MKDPARTWNAVVAGEDTPVLAGNQAARAPQGVRGAGRGEVLPPRFLREPRQAALDHRVRCRRNTGLASTRRLSSLLAGSMMRASTN